jgi:branched-chain amino acid transport system ATP-binding protein
MTVRENVMVGAHIGLPYSLLDALLWRRAFRNAERALKGRVDELLDTVGLLKRGDDAASSLSYGEQRRLELARALAARPRLLMLDEPAAGMNTREAIQLADLLRRLVAAGGLTIVLVEHNVRMVMNLCDRIAVINFGRKLAEGTPETIRANEAVIEAYLGTPA